ncbi:fatty acid desaturase [Marinobacter bohaiensis]|uniref:fatty acid desaturase n=1 Tax=Marinobacter bohaiensis TaxID=2201898 RepID=UPI000DACCCEC|nr:fatty acid desaturase [Marinobacter bohaiensis]
MSDLQALADKKKEIIARFSAKSNAIALWQLLTTLVPYGLFWYLAVESVAVSWWLTAGCIGVLCLFLLRVFVLMHDCGHNALFDKIAYNRRAGFLLGVVCGMPQYVWSKNHAFHHATNGNWDQYRGPLATLSLDEFNALTPAQQTRYRLMRHIAVAPLGGFLYLIFNPRYTWLKGSLALLAFILRGKLRQPTRSMRSIAGEFQPRYWKTWKDYRHMTANNLVLLSLWALMCAAVGPLVFFVIYLTSLSLSGAGGIILFTVQHNFEDSWAADESNWDYSRAAVEGTSFLVLPGWLNWFTADIAYHHVHHLSASIPNYRLAECHRAYAHLFADVTRITLRDVPKALRNNLWDRDHHRITSFEAVERRVSGFGVLSKTSA